MRAQRCRKATCRLRTPRTGKEPIRARATTTWSWLPCSEVALRPGEGEATPRQRVHARSVARRRAQRFGVARSEEHTSELQSQSNLVCRLLLEKKKSAERCRTLE